MYSRVEELEEELEAHVDAHDGHVDVVEELAEVLDGEARAEEDHNLLGAVLAQEREEQHEALVRVAQHVALRVRSVQSQLQLASSECKARLSDWYSYSYLNTSSDAGAPARGPRRSQWADRRRCPRAPATS